MSLGFPGVLVVGLFALLVFGLPVAAGVWALVTLRRIVAAVEAMELKIVSIDRAVHALANGRVSTDAGGA